MAKAYAPGFSNGRSSKPVGGFLEFTLRFATHVYGRVLDAETEAPISGATVSHWEERVASRADGSYRIDEILVLSSQVLVVRKRGYATLHQIVRPREPKPIALDLHLERGTAVSVAVIDAETTAPIIGARVYGSRLETAPQQHDELIATTDAAGRFTVHVVDGSHQVMSVLADDYCAFVWVWEAQDATGLQPTIPMRRLGTLEGRVQDTTGNNLANVNLSVTTSSRISEEDRRRLDLPGVAAHRVLSSRDRALSSRYCVTGDDGRFSWQVVPSSQPLPVTARRDGYLAYREPVTVPSHAPVWLDVVLDQAATIHGRVTYNDQPWMGSLMLKAPQLPNPVRVRIDAEGTYTLPSVPPGAVEISLGDNLAGQHSSTLLAVAGRRHEHNIEVRETLSTISGIVTNRAGEPIENAQVAARWKGPGRPARQFYTRPEEDGTYAIQVAPTHSYTVSAFPRGPGYAEIEVAVHGVAPGSVGVDLVLRKKGVLRLRFRDASTGEPVHTGIGSAGYSWRDSSTRVFQQVYSQIGDLDAEDASPLELPVGTLDLSLDFTESGYAPRIMRQLEVTDDPNPTHYTVELSPGLELELRLRGPEPFSTEAGVGPVLFLLTEAQSDDVQGPFEPGSAQANTEVDGVSMWLADPALWSRRLLPDDEQRAVIRGLAPGRYRIHAFPPVVAFDPEFIEVSELTPVVEVEWRPAPTAGR